MKKDFSLKRTVDLIYCSLVRLWHRLVRAPGLNLFVAFHFLLTPRSFCTCQFLSTV